MYLHTEHCAVAWLAVWAVPTEAGMQLLFLKTWSGTYHPFVRSCVASFNISLNK